MHPVRADAPEPEDGTDTAPDFDELAAELSDTWLVEPAVGEDGDDACLGPLTARTAWDLATDLDATRSSWLVSVVPMQVAGTADELAALFESDE